MRCNPHLYDRLRLAFWYYRCTLPGPWVWPFKTDINTSASRRGQTWLTFCKCVSGIDDAFCPRNMLKTVLNLLYIWPTVHSNSPESFPFDAYFLYNENKNCLWVGFADISLVPHFHPEHLQLPHYLFYFLFNTLPRCESSSTQHSLNKCVFSCFCFFSHSFPLINLNPHTAIITSVVITMAM